MSPVDEEGVLAHGGVFMLFYERLGGDERPPPRAESSLPVLPTAEIEAETDEAATQATDDEATIASEETLKQNVLAKFHEHDIEEPPTTPSSTPDPFLSSGASSPLEQPSTEATTEDEAEADLDDQFQHPQKFVSSTSPLRMRTARLDARQDFDGNTTTSFRPVAAT